MTADEFWCASPLLATAYRDAYKLRQRHENDLAWLQGVYFYSALGSVIGNMFGGKGSKKQEYFRKPLEMGLETEAEKADRVQREREKIIANLTLWKKMWDAQHKSGEKS